MIDSSSSQSHWREHSLKNAKSRSNSNRLTKLTESSLAKLEPDLNMETVLCTQSRRTNVCLKQVLGQSPSAP